MTSKTIPLSPVDYVFTGVGSQPITFAFDFPNPVDPLALKKSLKTTLDYFPILRSQLRKISETDYQFSITDDGCPFEVRESGISFEETREITEYITPVSSIEGKPLTNIRLTQTPKGSVLAASLSHALVDGFSYFHFLLSWAGICRGNPIFEPHLDRDVILADLIHKPETITPETVYSDCGLFYGSEQREPLTRHPDLDRIYISKETIGQHILNSKQKHDVSLSKNDVITALLWKKYVPRWNREEGKTKAYVTCPFDFRRVKTGFPPNYFGCALCFAIASTDMDNLLHAPVEDLARHIRKSVSRIKNDFVLNSLSTLESLRQQDGLAAMDKINLRHPKQGMIVTNLSRLPLRDIDFGSGPPADFLAFAEVFSSAAILPAENGVEILVMNPPKANP